MNTWFSATFGALAERHFRTLWAGSLFSFVAFFMSTIVQSVVAFQLTGTNSAVGAVVFAQGLAQFILGPLGGALADRLSKRLVISVCQVVITLAFTGLGLLITLDLISVPALAIGSFVVGCAFSFLGPSRNAFVIDLVEPNRRGNAIALTQVALNGSRILGPLFAGACLAVGIIGSAGAFYVMAGFYTLAIGTTVILPPSVMDPNRPRRSVLGDILGGLQYVWREPTIRPLVLAFVLVIMVGFPYVTVLPGLVENKFEADLNWVTILLGLTAIGGLTASLAVAGLADSPRARMIQIVCGIAFGASLILSGFAPNLFTLSLCMLLLGAASGGFQTLNGAVVARTSDPAYFGRVMSLTFLAFAAFGLVALPVGFVADRIGEAYTLVIMGVAVIGVLIQVMILPGQAPRRVTAPSGGK